MTTRTATCRCGPTVAYTIDKMPGLTAIAIGAFADPEFPAPAFSMQENRNHRWVEIIDYGVEHNEPIVARDDIVNL
jgi:hypothetical protein